MASLRKRGKVWYFRHTDADGIKREEKGCPDKRTTEEMARQAENEAAKIRAGLIDPKAERLAEAGRRPIMEHLEEYVANLKAKGDEPKHVQLTRTYAARILESARIQRIADLAPSVVLDALARLTGQGLSARTVNAHTTAVKGFARWLWRNGRSVDHPLAILGRLNEEADRRLVRRDLSEAELRRLLDSTYSADPWRGMSGFDRAIFYTIGALTGLRRSEMASLTPQSFRLDDGVPMVVVEAGHTKNGKLAEQPITAGFAESLRPWLASKAPGRSVFETLPEKTGLMLKTDLERCGIAPVDSVGRVVDTHSLRHGFITTLAKAGVSVKTLQTLARHSDPKLTLNIYAHLTRFDTAPALNALPDLSRPNSPPEAPKSLGTEPGVTPISERFAHYLPTGGDGSGLERTGEDGTTPSFSDEGECRNSLEMEVLDASGRELTASEESAPRRTRTYNPLIKSQLLCQLS